MNSLQHWCGLQATFGLEGAPALGFGWVIAKIYGFTAVPNYRRDRCFAETDLITAVARAATAAPAHATAPGLSISAVRGSSYVAVRRGAANGPVIFQGTVARGQTEPFAGTRFWINISSPENLVVRVRGKKIQLAGYRPRVVTVTPSSWHLG